MSTNKTLLLALGGAAAAGLIYRFLGTEKGKEFLNNATDYLKDLGGKVVDYAKSNVAGATPSTSTGQS